MSNQKKDLLKLRDVPDYWGKRIEKTIVQGLPAFPTKKLDEGTWKV